jgi:hypothetical protein
MAGLGARATTSTHAEFAELINTPAVLRHYDNSEMFGKNLRCFCTNP